MKNRDPRVTVHIPARMRIDGVWVDVSIRNLSSRGLMAKTSAEVTQRTYVELHRADQIIVGRIVWSRDGHFGLRAQDRIDMTGMMGRAQRNDGRGRQTGASTTAERRARPRAEASHDIARTAERSRNYANLFQFITIGTAAASGAVAAAIEVARLLQGAFAPALLALGR